MQNLICRSTTAHSSASAWIIRRIRRLSSACWTWAIQIQPPDRSVRHGGALTLTGLFYFIEPPHPTYPFETAEGIEITADGALSSLPRPPALLLPSVDEHKAFTHYFFVNDWNAFIYVAATGAQFEWTRDAR